MTANRRRFCGGRVAIHQIRRSQFGHARVNRSAALLAEGHCSLGGEPEGGEVIGRRAIISQQSRDRSAGKHHPRIPAGLTNSNLRHRLFIPCHALIITGPWLRHTVPRDWAKLSFAQCGGPNGVGRWRWVLSGGPACLVVVVGVAVSQNYGTVARCSVADRVWPVECPHPSAVGCGVLPAAA